MTEKPTPVLKIPPEAQGLLKIPLDSVTHPLVKKVCSERVLEAAAKASMGPTTRFRLLMYVSFAAIKYHQRWHFKYGGPD